MYLVMGITGHVGGATARHLLKQSKQVRALVRKGEKATEWADQGVELVDGDWNDATTIAAALKGVEGAFVMLPTVWAPSPDYREAKDVIANYVEALTEVVPPPVVALSSMGANRTSGLGIITSLSLFEQGFRSLPSPVAFVRAGGFFENFLFGLQAAQGGTLPVFYNPTNRKSTMVATNDIGAEVAKLLAGPPWSGHRVVELGSMVSADEVAEQLGQVLKRDVKAFAVPRAGWAEAFEQFGVPKGHTGPAEEMYEAVNASGDRPQAILNKQIAEQGDFLIGIFGNRLGTPTGDSKSGTIEEIEIFRRSGKHVALYFSTADVPRDVDRDQLEELDSPFPRRNSDSSTGKSGNTGQMGNDRDIRSLRAC